MSTARRLKTAVILSDPDGVFKHFGVGEALPAWAVKAVAGSDVLEGDEPEADEEEPETPVSAPEEPVVAESTPEAPAAPEDGSQEPSQPVDEDLIGSVETVEQPAGNGSLEDWAAFAQSKGATDEDLEGKSRNEIRAAYGV